MKKYPLITIITPTFNNKDTIEDTLKSVIRQNYPFLEYIIVDGCSKDGTLEILERYKNKITRVISEPDKGPYDAMNKGIKEANGEIVGILNSDDLYYCPDVLQKVAETFLKERIDCLWGDLVIVDRKNPQKTLRYWKASDFSPGIFKRGWMPPHPTFFVKKEIYEKYGDFDLNFPLAADYELMVRFLEKHKIKGFYLPKVLVKMRTGGQSSKNLINILKGNIECYLALRKNNIKVSPFFIFFKPLLKIPQFFSKKYG